MQFGFLFVDWQKKKKKNNNNEILQLILNVCVTVWCLRARQTQPRKVP